LEEYFGISALTSHRCGKRGGFVILYASCLDHHRFVFPSGRFQVQSCNV